MWNLKGNDRNEFTYKTERDSQTQNELMVAGVGERMGEGIVREFRMGMQTRYI